MKQYKINKRLYALRDFTFGEQEQVQLIRSEIAQVENDTTIKANLTNERLVEVLNFILETLTGEPPAITIEDIANTGMRALSELILDFVTYEIQYAIEKKKYFENSMKELAPLMKVLKRSKK